MATYDLLIRSRRTVTPDGERPAGVAAAAGRIVAVLEYDEQPSATQIVDVGDDVLMPGLVDTHVHVNEPGRTEWEGFATATRAAAAGGVTTIVDMPLNSIPPTTTVEALVAKQHAARGQCFVDVGFWGGIVPGNLDDLRPLHEAGVFGFKCFLCDSGVPEFPAVNAGELHAAMERVQAFDGLVIVHAEDQAGIDAAPRCAGAGYDDFLASRPATAEDGAISDVISASRATGARAHVLHLSSADALPLIAAAKRAGTRITAETCPHYLALSAEQVPVGGTQFKCCPPIRDAANSDRLWGGLADATIDLVVSDHSPCPAELKSRETGDFGTAWGGISSLQLALPVVWTEARRRGRSLQEVVAWMSAHPARLAGLSDKGGIAVGRSADFAVFAPDEVFVVDPARLRHRHPVTPYAGQELHGIVRSTWLRGEQIGDEPAGRLLSRHGGG
ncbi:MAG: allantoinase AllB [Mycobacteriales bacterium]